MRRRVVIGIACIALAGAIGLAAIVDHRNKQARINRAELAEWYCEYDGTQCGGASSARIETHWNQRQVAYEIAVGLFTAAALVAGGSALRVAPRRKGLPGA